MGLVFMTVNKSGILYQDNIANENKDWNLW